MHPLVSCAVLVEHGCEKTHNDRLSGALRDMGVSQSTNHQLLLPFVALLFRSLFSFLFY